jgi:hypothetical protein
VDDRVDMYPPDLVDDSLTLVRARPGWAEVLERHRAGAVLWPREDPLTAKLRASDTWRVAYRDADWQIWLRT